jgi:hypothetical protein
MAVMLFTYLIISILTSLAGFARLLLLSIIFVYLPATGPIVCNGVYTAHCKYNLGVLCYCSPCESHL